jgi:hypothetical protein
VRLAQNHHQFTRKNGRDRFACCSRSGMSFARISPLFSSKRRTRDEPCCSEFTQVERREPLQRRFLKRLMVVLLTFRADCSLFALITTNTHKASYRVKVATLKKVSRQRDTSGRRPGRVPANTRKTGSTGWFDGFLLCLCGSFFQDSKKDGHTVGSSI